LLYLSPKQRHRKCAIYRGEGGAGDATADASNAAALADAFADAANASAGQAATSAAAAEAAKLAAELAETNAETAETNAEAAEAAAVVAKNAAEAVLLDTGFTVVASDLQGADTIGTVAADIVNVNEVANNIAAVIAVDANEANINIVAADGTDIGIVATSIADVNSVAANILDVTAVADNETNIDAVAANNTNITTVAGISGNVTTVAGISANVTTVATNDTNVTTVATNIANVNAVGTNIANVNSVAGNATNINAVASNSTNINTVAGISANVTTVATNNANVTTVAGSIANVNTNATNIANINQNAANIVAIQNASANATAAASSATAAAGSATSASASAAAASAVALGNEPVRHSVRPSLLLDFANTKTLDPRITFTRASTATFYDGKTVAKAEENLLQYSQEFDNAYWTKSQATITANSTTAPDGTTTAESLVEGSGTVTPVVTRAGLPVISGQTYVLSVFAKANTRSWLRIAQGNSAFGAGDYLTVRSVYFDLTNGVVGTKGSTFTSASITSVGNGWYRCVAIGTAASSTNLGFDIGVASADLTGSFTGDGASNIFIWGAQLEQRSSVTAYTATTTAPITNYIPALQTAASGVARFEHNPITGESLGLEIEEQRTNLILQSETFDNASWTKTNSSITANTVVAPDGTLTGDALIENTSSSTHTVYARPNITNGTTYALSFYVKPAGRNRIVVQQFNSSTAYANANFDVSTGSVITSSGTGASASIISVGNGWYRCVLIGVANATATSYMQVSLAQSGYTTAAPETYAGDGYSGVYIWGAQLEAGAFATSYIPTVASQVTRSADAASMTGTNFSSWYRADEGTIYAETISPNSFSRCQASINDGTNNNKIEPALSSGNTYLLGVNVGGTAVGSAATANTATANTASKTAGAYRVNDFAVSLNAGTVATDTSGAIPIVDRMFIGQRTAGSVSLNGTIKKLAYYPKRLANEELVGLSTI
jgi:hypothetical protein